jgi:hypothetical protein
LLKISSTIGSVLKALGFGQTKTLEQNNDKVCSTTGWKSNLLLLFNRNILQNRNTVEENQVFIGRVIE